MITFRVFPHDVSEEGEGQLCVGAIEQPFELRSSDEVPKTADVHPHLLQSVRLCRGWGQEQMTQKTNDVGVVYMPTGGHSSLVK